MNFEHTEDRRMLADTLDRFIADQYDFPARDKIATSDAGYSPELWAQFAELGAIGALFPEADGGFGGAGFDLSVVFQSLGRGLVVEPFLGALMVGRAIGQAGSEAQKARIASLIDGSLIAALAHDEPQGHHSETRVGLRAERKGDGWVLNGAKSVVKQGEAANLFLVSARTAGAEDDADGISLFLVPGDAAGLARRGYRLIDGGRAADLTFEQVEVPADALLGTEGQGAAVLQHALGYGLLGLCAEAVGAMDVARDATLEYLRTRKQFGVPLGSFQALQHRMADLLLEIEQARSAVINAAAAIDGEPAQAARTLAATKYTIGRIGIRVAEESIQLHGGIGMTWELPLAHVAKRLVMIDHELGDEDHHLERYIALGARAAA
ncbi:pimeloyl-CoA dehydrogenase small subunit [Verticiella sediminum]|uniref:Pimeloyl-CoA dehydrogenase small subunit n=1 Tax=Verticiella sediminum TaxID=1247510 RepID=A0A556AUB7_9BURK|nr:acyl-CoA dehydrogenase family protein [Verticiella sediminum]TSH96510.1 pimeloyl-CoA dehydrogenase small subunit [Verticiella sediminum]